MKTQLPKNQIAFIPTTILAFFFCATNAQIVYTDVIPDSVASCSTACFGGISCSQTFNIDLNQDGQDDFRLTTISTPHITFPINIPCTAAVSVYGLNGNEVSCNNMSQALATDANSEIFGGTWDSSYATLRRVFGGVFSGLWPQSSDKYLGVRLQVGGNFYYGWIRLSLSVNSSVHASCTTKDFAFNSIPDSSILAADTGIPLAISTLLAVNNFSISPNPTSDKITLSFSSSGIKEIQCINALGQIVFSEKVNAAKEEIDVREFPPGIYVVSAQTSTQKIEKKFLKQ